MSPVENKDMILFLRYLFSCTVLYYTDVDVSSNHDDQSLGVGGLRRGRRSHAHVLQVLQKGDQKCRRCRGTFVDNTLH